MLIVQSEFPPIKRIKASNLRDKMRQFKVWCTEDQNGYWLKPPDKQPFMTDKGVHDPVKAPLNRGASWNLYIGDKFDKLDLFSGSQWRTTSGSISSSNDRGSERTRHDDAAQFKSGDPRIDESTETAVMRPQTEAIERNSRRREKSPQTNAVEHSGTVNVSQTESTGHFITEDRQPNEQRPTLQSSSSMPSTIESFEIASESCDTGSTEQVEDTTAPVAKNSELGDTESILHSSESGLSDVEGPALSGSRSNPSPCRTAPQIDQNHEHAQQKDGTLRTMSLLLMSRARIWLSGMIWSPPRDYQRLWYQCVNYLLTLKWKSLPRLLTTYLTGVWKDDLYRPQRAEAWCGGKITTQFNRLSNIVRNQSGEHRSRTSFNPAGCAPGSQPPVDQFLETSSAPGIFTTILSNQQWHRTISSI